MQSQGRWNAALVVGALALGLVAFVGASITTNAEQNRRWWWDNLAGPDSSNFVDADQIKKNNVSQLEVAWTYPYAAPGFNPVVVEDVVVFADGGPAHESDIDRGDGDEEEDEGRRGRLWSLSSSDGRVRWKSAFDGVDPRGK